MATSLRARLSVWNAGAFAVLLGAFAAGTYAFVAATTATRADAYLTQTAGAVGEALGEALDEARAGPADTTAAGARRAASVALAALVRRFRYRDIGVAVFDATPSAADGGPRVIAASGGDPFTYPFAGPWGARAAAPLVARAVRAGSVVATLGAGPSAERVAAAAVPRGGRVLVVAASQSLGTQHEVLLQAREALIAGVLLTGVVVAAGGWALTWWSLRPIAVISRRAARIEAGTLHERLPVAADVDELARLATAFNGLLERLQRSFEQQRQFMAEASHELRTPVAIVRGEAELALAQPTRAEAEYRAALATVRGQAEALTRLVDDLFLLARANAGERAVAGEPLFLEELVDDCVRAVRTLAAARGVVVTFAPDAELPARGDARLLRRMLLNLLDNAIKYTPPGGRVEVTAAPAGVPAGLPVAPPGVPPVAGQDDGASVPVDAAPLAAAGTTPAAPWARLRVRDTGPGIPPEARARVFDRFFRARSGGIADPTGAGLGLAIVAWVAEQHGGRALLRASGAEGTTFEIELPLAPPA